MPDDTQDSRVSGMYVPSPPGLLPASHVGDASVVSLSDARCGIASPLLLPPVAAHVTGSKPGDISEPRQVAVNPVRGRVEEEESPPTPSPTGLRLLEERMASLDSSDSETEWKKNRIGDREVSKVSSAP